LLQVVENPVRRSIIKRLSREPAYALQLSKELGLGQPLVAKHLQAMESAGLVATTIESSPRGPDRKKYSLAKGITITLDLGPNLFIERGATFHERPEKSRRAGKASVFMKQIQSAQAEEEDRRLSLISEILSSIDARMQEIEEERSELLEVRNLAMEKAVDAAGRFEESDVRRVLFHVLDEHDRAVESISNALNLRELSVRAILGELQKYLD